MKILSISSPFTTQAVRTDEKEYPNYERSGPNSWDSVMEESLRPVYCVAELEKAYQQFIIESRKEEVNSEIRNIIKYFDSVEEIAVSYGGTEAKTIMRECDAARAEAYRILDKIMLDYDIIETTEKNN